MELDRKLWLTADRDRVVEDGDPEAAFLLGNEGTELSTEEAERLGLGKGAKKKEPAEDKQAEEPANKAVKKAAKK